MNSDSTKRSKCRNGTSVLMLRLRSGTERTGRYTQYRYEIDNLGLTPKYSFLLKPKRKVLRWIGWDIASNLITVLRWIVLVEVEDLLCCGCMKLNWKWNPFSSHHIDAFIGVSNGSNMWRFTRFYGSPEVSQREKSWDKLRHLKNLSSLSWLCAGDFNEILGNDEKIGGLLKPTRQMESFR